MSLLDYQLGVAEESTYGTPVTPTRFYEFTSESLKHDIERIESAGLRKGTRYQRSDRWKAGKKAPGGDVTFELVNKSMGLLFKHAIGSAVVTTPGGTTPRDITCTPADLPTGLTLQKGLPKLDGVVQPFTYHGAKVASWKLEGALDQIGMLTLSFVAEDEDTTTGLAAASYPTGLSLFSFVEGKLSVAGAEVFVDSFSLETNNALKDDRFRIGSQLRREPKEAQVRESTGEFTADFDSTTAYNRFTTGLEAALELLFRGAEIEPGFNYEVKATLNVRFDGETANADGPEEIRQPLRFKALDSGSGPGSALTLVYRTTDTAP